MKLIKLTEHLLDLLRGYDLVELSIVDSPANELCNVLSISKVNGKLIFKGIAANVSTENIFYCQESDSVFISTEKTYDSPITGKPAELIGWVESSDVNKAKEIDKILASFKKSRLPLPDTQIAKQANVEGGNEVSEETTVDATAEVVEETTVVADEATDAPAEAEAEITDAPADSVEKAADAQVMVDEPDFAKMLGDLKGFFSETLTKATEINAAQVSDIKETVESFSKSVDSRITELVEKHAALSAAVTDIKGTIDGVQKRVDAVEGETAFKKSSDLGGSQEVITKSKSKWNGSFLGSVNEIFN